MVPPIGQIRAGKLRALCGDDRHPLGGVAVAWVRAGLQASAWFGIGASKRTPEPKLQARLTNVGGTVLGRSPADLAKLISHEVKT